MTYTAEFNNVSFEFFPDRYIADGRYLFRLGGDVDNLRIYVHSDPEYYTIEMPNNKEILNALWTDKTRLVKISQRITTRL